MLGDLTVEAVTSRVWCFGREDGSVIAPQLRLLANGRLALHAHWNEASWALQDGVLTFRDGIGAARTRFEETDGGGRMRLVGPFLPDPAIRHVLTETDRVERHATEAEAVTPLARGTEGRRPYLVVLRAGDSSLHTSWARDIPDEDRSWDLCISWYGADRTLGEDELADWEAMQPADRKFQAIWKLFSPGSPLWNYEYVMFPDDDLRMSWSGINRLFAVARENGLLIAQPALAKDGFITHDITRQRPHCRLRFTDFAEVMTPLFARRALEVCMPTFGLSRGGFGLDHIWPKLLGHPDSRVAIIDDVAVTHTRPVGSAYNLREAADEGLALMARFGAWESFRELGRIHR